MKFSEKIVSYFESCNSPVDKEGYLSKKGELKTSYQKRWFVLKGNLLFYKDRPDDRDLAGVIVVEGCTVQLCESDEQFAFSLVWSEPGLRTYKFAAEDQASQESWIKALLSANHNYLSLLVMDLEKKYRDALGEFSKEPPKAFTMPNFSTTQPGFAQPSLIKQTSTLPVAGAGLSPTSSAKLQPPHISSKSASKKSPKLWPKKSANVMPINTPAPPLGEWSGLSFGTKNEFSTLHEDFGKEVKELIADWLKRGRGGEAVQEENLIDFG